MIGIFTGARIKELDRYTIEHEPVSSIDLVERAAATWVYEFERLYTQQRRIVVFAGPGNNGADALCAARILGENGYSVDAFLFNVSGSLSPECNECRVRLLETSGIRLTEVVDNFIPPELSSQTVVVDGLFGVGLNRPLQGGFAKVVEFLNQSGAEIVSIDIPSGLFEEDNFGNNPNAIIRATHTLTFEYPKLSFLFSENADYVGKWKVNDQDRVFPQYRFRYIRHHPATPSFCAQRNVRPCSAHSGKSGQDGSGLSGCKGLSPKRYRSINYPYTRLWRGCHADRRAGGHGTCR